MEATAAIGPGVLLVDKPPGKSSFAVVQKIRKLSGVKKVGHAGTLDPFATGLLVICIGRPATRLIDQLMVGEKKYQAVLQLGITTETQDPEGQILERREVGEIGPETVEACLDRYRGRILQQPPAYSALKHKGKPLYYYARRGIEVKKEAREVEIKRLLRLDEGPVSDAASSLAVEVVCSKGTYIRVLAKDIGDCLGCGAYLRQLRRLASGCFAVEKALSWQSLSDEGSLEICRQRLIGLEEVAKLLQ